MFELFESEKKELFLIQSDFYDLIKSIKSKRPWDFQQKHEWVIPSYEMFEDLLKACIQEKV